MRLPPASGMLAYFMVAYSIFETEPQTVVPEGAFLLRIKEAHDGGVVGERVEADLKEFRGREVLVHASRLCRGTPSLRECPVGLPAVENADVLALLKNARRHPGIGRGYRAPRSSGGSGSLGMSGRHSDVAQQSCRSIDTGQKFVFCRRSRSFSWP